MSVLSSISSLRDALSSSSEILTDRNSTTFKEYLKRWTDIGLKTPAAIALPTSEKDCQKIVQWAIRSSIPFVTRSGGHSEWSTIGMEGIIVDLRRFSGVDVNTESHTATLTGSVLSKEVAVRLAEEGMCTAFTDHGLIQFISWEDADQLYAALGNGNTVGAIPYFIGGGNSITSSVTGFGSDQIVSARLISAKGDLLDVNEETYPDLLWAVRGAGQFFGLVTELVIEALPLSVLGNDKGVIWAGTFVFPLDRAKEVCTVMEDLMSNNRYGTSGLMMIIAPPPARKPSLVISTVLTGDPRDAQEAFKPLYDLQPVKASGAEVPIQNASDAVAAMGAKGDFKRFGIVGLHRFEVDLFMKTVTLWKEMMAECPDAINTSFNFKWDSRPVKSPRFDSAMSLHDIRYWQNNLIWHTDYKNRSIIDEYNERSIATMRSSQKKADWVDYQNNTRIGPPERRYRGKERLDRLMRLKKVWDPTGVFTDQLL